MTQPGSGNHRFDPDVDRAAALRLVTESPGDYPIIFGLPDYLKAELEAAERHRAYNQIVERLLDVIGHPDDTLIAIRTIRKAVVRMEAVRVDQAENLAAVRRKWRTLNILIDSVRDTLTDLLRAL